MCFYVTFRKSFFSLKKTSIFLINICIERYWKLSKSVPERAILKHQLYPFEKYQKNRSSKMDDFHPKWMTIIFGQFSSKMDDSHPKWTKFKDKIFNNNINT